MNGLRPTSRHAEVEFSRVTGMLGPRRVVVSANRQCFSSAIEAVVIAKRLRACGRDGHVHAVSVSDFESFSFGRSLRSSVSVSMVAFLVKLYRQDPCR